MVLVFLFGLVGVFFARIEVKSAADLELNLRVLIDAPTSGSEKNTTKKPPMLGIGAEGREKGKSLFNIFSSGPC